MVKKISLVYPPKNKVTARAINYCKHYVLEEIENYKPELIFLLGNSPLKAILGETGITAWNGIVVQREEAIYVPLFHPAYILRNSAVMDDWLRGMLNGIDKLFEEEEEKEVFEFLQPISVWELMEMRDQLKESEWIAYDTETTTLDATEEDAQVVAISLSDGEHTYAFPVGHKDAYWSEGDTGQLEGVLEDIFDDHEGKIIGHNLKFDLKHTLNHFGFDFESGGDSMLVSHLVDSRTGIHSLKRLAGMYLEMYDYDKGLQDYIQDHPEANPKKGGNYGNIPLEVLLPYAAKDAYATYKLHWKLYEDLSEKQKLFYHEVLMPVSDVLGYTEYSGFMIDQFIAQRYVHIYEIRKQELYEELAKDPKVPKALKILQKESDEKMIGKMYPYELKSDNGLPPRDHFVISADRIMFDDGEKKRNRKRPIIEFNPNSTRQLRALYYNAYKIPVDPKVLTPSGLPPTGEDAVRKYKEKYPIIEEIRYFKLISKVLSTYLIPACGSWLGSDGKARSTYGLHATKTGRLASSNPNFQNIPTPDKEPGTLLEWLPVRNIFTSSFPNGIIMSADYVGMELRVYASLANCREMLEIHRSGRDFHRMIASSITGIPYSNIKKSTRRFYKQVNFAMLYRGSEYTLYHKFGIPLEEGKYAIDAYHREFPSVEEFGFDCIDFASRYGYIESPFGRRERLLYINDSSDRNRSRRNQDIRYAVNMPVQSGAGDILLCALIVLDGKLYERELDTKIVNTVHDNIVLDVPEHEIDVVASLCRDVMENIIEYAKTYMPSIDFSWLLSPLKADIDIGSHYGTHLTYEEWIDERKAHIVS